MMMKFWNYRHVVFLLGGLLLLGVIVPGSGGEEKKKKIATDKKGPVLRGISPMVIEVERGAPKKYVPFTLADLSEREKKKVTKDTILVLANKEKVPAQLHLDAINKFEDLLTKRGDSLRDKPGAVVVQRVPMNTALFAKQARATAGLRRDPKAVAIPTIAQMESRHEAKVKAAKFSFKGKDVPGPTAVLMPVSTVKSFEDHLGDSHLNTTVKANLTLKGDSFGVSASAEARAAVSVLGHTTDVLVASASLTAPRTGGLKAKLKATILGVDQLVLDQSEPAAFTKQGNFTRTLPDVLHVSYNFTLLFIPLHAELGVRGSVNVPYYVSLLPGSTEVLFIPEVKSNLYADLALGAVVDHFGVRLGAVAGVEAQLILLNSKLVLHSQLEQRSDEKGVYVKEAYDSRNVLDSLSGKVVFYVEVDWILGKYRKEQEFMKYTGFHHDVTPFYGSLTRYLQPPLLSPKN